MASPYGTLLLLARRDELRGRVAASMPEIRRALDQLELDHVPVEADSLAAIEAAARSGVREGYRFLVAVGGDATVHAVANGMFEDGRPLGEDLVLGQVPGGAVNDIVRTLGLPPDERAIAFLQGDRVLTSDVVLAHVEGRGGPPRVVVNMAEAGLGGAVARRTEGLPAVLGRARTFLGFWSALASFRPVGATLAGDRRTWEGRVHDVIVANGQYLRDAMRLSPKSWPDDGFFEVLVMTGPKSDSFTIIPKSYLGEHLPHPNIVEYRSRTLRVETARPVPVHLDGVPTGSTPVRFELLPKALRLKT